MKALLCKLALAFGVLGFLGYLILLLSSALGVVFDIDDLLFHKIIIGVFSLVIIAFMICLFKGCKCMKRGNDGKEE